jgi:hypothetical protein
MDFFIRLTYSRYVDSIVTLFFAIPSCAQDRVETRIFKSKIGGHRRSFLRN